MGKYEEAAKTIQWASHGRRTVAFELGLSLLAVGVLPYAPKRHGDGPLEYVSNESESFENTLMDIHGTAIQVAAGKLITCAHVLDSVKATGRPGYIQTRTLRDATVLYGHFPYQVSINYVDPRTMKENDSVDAAAVLAPVVHRADYPYEVPYIRWGNSSKLGVGDRVMVGGYPLGTRLFLANQTHRGFIQPTFFEGIVSAVIPALKPTEVRLLQLSMPVEGGMSGGAVFDPKSGKVLGMVHCGLNRGETEMPMPFTYAIPSEVLDPFVAAISFNTRATP